MNGINWTVMLCIIITVNLSVDFAKLGLKRFSALSWTLRPLVIIVASGIVYASQQSGLDIKFDFINIVIASVCSIALYDIGGYRYIRDKIADIINTLFEVIKRRVVGMFGGSKDVDKD